MPDQEFDPIETPILDDQEQKGESQDGEVSEFVDPAAGEIDTAPEADAAFGDAETADFESIAQEPEAKAADAEQPAPVDADAPAADEGADDAAVDADAEAQIAPVAEDGNVVHPESIDGPLDAALVTDPGTASGSTDQAPGEAADAGEAEATGDESDDGDEAKDPVPATPAPLDAIRAGAGDGGQTDPSAGIVPQPSAEDALAARPLSGIASEEARGAVDAMPTAAQQHMGQWVKGVHEAEPAEAGQLPTASDLPGTPFDATGVGTYSDTGLTRADEALETRADDGDEAAQEAIDGGKGPGGSAPAGDTPEGCDEGSADEGDKGFEDAGVDVDAGSDDESESDDSYFGSPKVQYGPFVDVAEEGVEAFKQAAEHAALAQNHLQNVPFAVLDLEHKDLVMNLRVTIGDLLRLAAEFFERNNG